MPLSDYTLDPAGWYKSTRSGGSDNCVEVKHLPGGSTEVRNSRQPQGLVLTFTSGMWAGLLKTVAAQQFPENNEWAPAQPDQLSTAVARYTAAGMVEFAHSDAEPADFHTFTADEWEAFIAGACDGQFRWQPSEAPAVV